MRWGSWSCMLRNQLRKTCTIRALGVSRGDSSPRCICPGRRRVPRRAVGCAGQTLQLTRRPQKQRSKRSSASVAPKRWFSWINVLFARMMRDGLNATVVARSSAPTVRSPPSAVRAPGLVRICRAHQPSPRPCYSCNRTVTAPKAKLGCGRHAASLRAIPAPKLFYPCGGATLFVRSQLQFPISFADMICRTLMRQPHANWRSRG